MTDARLTPLAEQSSAPQITLDHRTHDHRHQHQHQHPSVHDSPPTGETDSQLVGVEIFPSRIPGYSSVCRAGQRDRREASSSGSRPGGSMILPLSAPFHYVAMATRRERSSSSFLLLLLWGQEGKKRAVKIKQLQISFFFFPSPSFFLSFIPGWPVGLRSRVE